MAHLLLLKAYFGHFPRDPNTSQDLSLRKVGISGMLLVDEEIYSLRKADDYTLSLQTLQSILAGAAWLTITV